MKKEENLKEKAKNFFKRNWKSILMTGAGIIVGELILNKQRKTASDHSQFTVDEIDEDIFTNLAPAIEKAVKDRELEKTVIEEAYDLGDRVNKFVTVTIENVYGD